MSSQPFRRFDVSLVIPVRDEAATVRDLLASIRSQTRRPDEVVIVDGGSSDGTATLLRQLADEDASLTVHVIEAGQATPGRGRNVGTAAARFEWIAYTDAGIRLDPMWLEELVAAAHRDASASVVYGTYEPIVETFSIAAPCSHTFRRPRLEATVSHAAPSSHRVSSGVRPGNRLAAFPI